MKKSVILLLVIVALLIVACGDKFVSRTVIDKYEDKIGYRLVLLECPLDNNVIEECEKVTYLVTKEAYDINEVGKEYKKP